MNEETRVLLDDWKQIFQAIRNKHHVPDEIAEELVASAELLVRSAFVRGQILGSQDMFEATMRSLSGVSK